MLLMLLNHLSEEIQDQKLKEEVINHLGVIDCLYKFEICEKIFVWCDYISWCQLFKYKTLWFWKSNFSIRLLPNWFGSLLVQGILLTLKIKGKVISYTIPFIRKKWIQMIKFLQAEAQTGRTVSDYNLCWDSNSGNLFY
jgi:hypothetical protein